MSNSNCDYCNYCDSCNSCNYCNSCNSCYYCNSCDYCRNLKMTEYNLFCYAENYNDDDSFQQKRYRFCNKEVGEKRYGEIKSEVNKILDGLKLELKENSWEDEWKKVTSDQWKKILDIKESDQVVIEKIIGFKIELSDTVTIECEGKKVEISRQSAKNLNLI